MQPRPLVLGQWIGSINMLTEPHHCRQKVCNTQVLARIPLFPLYYAIYVGSPRVRAIGDSQIRRSSRDYKIPICNFDVQIRGHALSLHGEHANQPVLSSSEQCWRSGRMKRNLPITGLALTSSLSELIDYPQHNRGKFPRKRRVSPWSSR